MFNNKYSKTLTVILVIVIIAIVGLLIYFGIDVYKKYYIQQASEEVVKEFQNTVDKNEDTTEDNIPLNNIGPGIDLNTLYQDNQTQTGGSGVKYMGYDVIGTIEIPATDVEYPIIPDDQASIDSLNVAIVKLYPSNLGLNEVGNTVLVGHNYKNGTFFSNNKNLKNGDAIYITDTSGRKIKYEIYNKYETSTYDSEYMNRETNGRREISLSTCTDDTKGRLIIWAKEAE